MRAVITLRLTGRVGFTNDNKSPIIHGRVIRATPDKENRQLRVRIHNIRSARPEPEIEILYAVYEDGDGKPILALINRAVSRICLESEPILATDAVRVMTDNVNQDEAVLLLGHPLKIAAERKVYTLTNLIIKLIMSQLICNRRRSSTSPHPQNG